MTKFVKQGNTFRVYSDSALDVHQSLPPGTFTVKFDQNNGEFFLEKIDDFNLTFKMYGDILRHVDRILTTFENRGGSTGVLLAGEKGSGKTLLAKKLSMDARKKGIPTLVINEPWRGSIFNEFIQNMTQPVVVLFDEYEKVYNYDEQSAMLTLLDGVFETKKLFILTCNEGHRINNHMMNRPGRLFYYINFDALEAEFIIEYCIDNLKNMDWADTIVKMASVFSHFNFDMLQALVEEMNRYDESPFEAIKMLNVRPESGDAVKYEIELYFDGEKIKKEEIYTGNDGVISINPLNPFDIYFGYGDDDNNDSLEVSFNPEDIKSVDGKEGIYVFENEDKKVLLKLIRQKILSYDSWAAF